MQLKANEVYVVHIWKLPDQPKAFCWCFPSKPPTHIHTWDDGPFHRAVQCVCVCSHTSTTHPLSQHNPLTFMAVMDRLISVSYSFLSFSSFCADTALFQKLW